MIFDRPAETAPSQAAVTTLRALIGVCLGILAIAWLAGDPSKTDAFDLLLFVAFAALYGIALLFAAISPETGAAVAGGIAVIVLVLVTPLAALLTWIGAGLHDLKRADLPGLAFFWLFMALQIGIAIAARRVRRHATAGGIVWVGAALAGFFVLSLFWKSLVGH